ncbi:hypothetical protein DR64_875 [Paraburkholderia xenovorans LB400]|nr:hypothetical protein DR64_875 [Paraburkholderia xenovorans LB400]
MEKIGYKKSPARDGAFLCGAKRAGGHAQWKCGCAGSASSGISAWTISPSGSA